MNLLNRLSPHRCPHQHQVGILFFSLKCCTHVFSALLRDDPAYHRGDVSIDMGMSGPTQAQMLEQQEKFIQERADAMQNIESTIVELGSIFQQLATMVKEQEEQVMR